VTAVRFSEDAASRRWLAARAMRVPLVLIKFGSPVLVMAALAIIVNSPNLAAQPLDVLTVLTLPFGVPFLLALVYPYVRWTSQAWTLDERGITGTGRVPGTCPWPALAAWTIVPAAPLADAYYVRFLRAPAWRHWSVSMMVPAAERAAVEAWLSTGRAGRARTSDPSHPPRPVPSGDRGSGRRR
jgi:hypothetical protein